MTTLAVSALWALAALVPDHSGAIAGRVVNGSQGRQPVPQAAVVLRVADGGGLVPVAETTCDDDGRFRFAGLPILDAIEYLPGANHQDVHYPGARVRLTGPEVEDVELVVFDTRAEPSPLVAARHVLRLRSEGEAVFVEESLVVANRSRFTYVGQPAAGDGPGITLRLSLPPEFVKVTFAQEFFGRQFQLQGRVLETQVPFPPGQRELAFTYWAPREAVRGVLRRTLDLPTERLRIEADRRSLPDLAANLPPSPSSTAERLIFETEGDGLPAGQSIELSWRGPYVSWATYGRWLALVALAGLIALSWLRLRRSRLGRAIKHAQPAPPPQRSARAA